MRLLEFLHRIDEEALLEAAKDRYMQMFQNLPQPGEEYLEFQDMEQKIAERVKWAIETFKKSDGITWYLRYYRLFILKSLASKPVDDEKNEPWLQQAKQMFAKEVRRLGSKSGLGDNISSYVDTIAMPAEMQKFTHFMSLPISGIQDYEFAWQTDYDVMNDFTRMETAWQESRKGMVPQREEQTIVLQFKDGSAWVNLNKAGCEEEGGAMGHCGNAPTQREGQTVLSYRTLEKDDDGNPAWKPHLTFIYDTVTGYLGEMKGRNNNPPDKKYHEVIMELLKLPMIKGIIGGGYKPENNFKLSDLTEEQFDYMSELKPELLGPYDQYLNSGRKVTPELVEKLDNMLNDEYEMGFAGYDEDKDSFILDRNVGGVEDIYNAGQVESELWIDDDDVDKLLRMVFKEHLDKAELATLARYYNNQYPEEDPIKNLTDAEAIYEALLTEDDDVIDDFKETLKEYLEGYVKDESRMQIENLEEYGYDSEEGNYGMAFVENDSKGDSYSLVANPEPFLENALPKVVAEEGGESWMNMSMAHWLRDPNEDWQERILHDSDDEGKEYLGKDVAANVKKKPNYINAVQIGENPGLTAEREHGQERLFASLGLEQ